MNTIPMQTEYFADLMSELPAGVCVVTLGVGGRPMGLAVTSLTAYTADPPSIMLSVSHTSRAHRHLVVADEFGAHLLSADQEHVAKALASRSDDKFADLQWSWDGQVPRIHDTVAYGRLSVEKTFDHWDHTVVIARIRAVDRAEGFDPMVYLRRNFAWRLSS